MKKLLLTTATFVAATLGGGNISHAQTAYSDMPAGVYNLDETHASLTWKVWHAGLSNYTARFTNFDADLDFNPQHCSPSGLMRPFKGLA